MLAGNFYNAVSLSLTAFVCRSTQYLCMMFQFSVSAEYYPVTSSLVIDSWLCNVYVIQYLA